MGRLTRTPSPLEAPVITYEGISNTILKRRPILGYTRMEVEVTGRDQAIKGDSFLFIPALHGDYQLDR
jgi:hypothetical protein